MITHDAWAFAKSLAALTLISLPFFLFTGDSQVSRFAKVTPGVAAVILVVTVLGLLGCRRGLDKLIAGAAGVAGVAGVLQLVQTGRDTNLLGGNASTFSLLLGLTLGWGTLAWLATTVAHEGEPEV